MTCKHDVIVAHENIGTDEEPEIVVMALCDGPPTGKNEDDCGWSVPHLDLFDQPHTPGDWWITSSDMAEYVRLHEEFNDNA